MKKQPKEGNRTGQNKTRQQYEEIINRKKKKRTKQKKQQEKNRRKQDVLHESKSHEKYKEPEKELEREEALESEMTVAETAEVYEPEKATGLELAEEEPVEEKTAEAVESEAVEEEPEPAVESETAEMETAEEETAKEEAVTEEPAEPQEATEPEIKPETVAEDSQGAKKPKKAGGRRKSRKWKTWQIWLLVACIALVAIGGITYLILPYLDVKKELTIEAGSDMPQVVDFLKWDSKSAKIVSGLTEDTNLNTVADYEVVVCVYHREITVPLHVQDTVAPGITTQNQTIFSGDAVKPSDFVKEIEDITKTDVTFEEEPDIDTEGTREVVLVVTDEGENVTKATAELEVLVDKEPPVISGVKEITVTVGSSISYKKDVTVTDDYDKNVKLTIDNSEVNLDEAGDYKVTYSAVDASGNEASVTTMVHVKQPSIETATEDTINAAADKILASILTDGMSQYEKAQAIYWWCHDKIAYVDGASKDSYVKGAYQGLVNRRGDCYTYAMSSKCLLTRAGITNMDIEKIRVGNTMHFWNLIDVGEGWYHFDTARRADGTTFFYKTDAELMAYSDTHNGSHNYDRSLYPPIN